MKMSALAYTDGACSGNPGPGGWGIYWTEVKNESRSEEEFYGSKAGTTNQQMELTAAVEALRVLQKKKGQAITIYTDSKYVMDGITQYVENWIANGWKKSNGKAVANLELWQELHKLSELFVVNWEWVKGHAGHEGNEKADKLAVKGCEEAKQLLENK